MWSQSLLHRNWQHACPHEYCSRIDGSTHAMGHMNKRKKARWICYGEGRSANRSKWSSQDSNTGEEEEEESRQGGLEASEGARHAGVSVWDCVNDIGPQIEAVDRLVVANTRRVQEAFRKYRVGPHHFQGSTGYGHGDLGRCTLDEIMADVMGAESAAVRIQFVSGTHAIAAGLFSCLRPGDELLAVAGSPYDTLEEVIGTRGQENSGSLIDFGVSYRKLELRRDGSVDFEALRTSVSSRTRVALVQRSCGYALRPTLKISEIEQIVECVKSQNTDTYVIVDNCYGEFTEEREPPSVGADLCMGSFIKNPGGTIATGGGYVAGLSDLVERSIARMSAPGVGMDAGSVPGETLRLLYQGLYIAPATVGEALKSGRLIAQVFSKMGYTVIPEAGHPDVWSFITAIEMKNPDAMVAFCNAVQLCCPVGSYVQPVPGVTPGYGDEVIFADVTFIDGSTAEMSADGPIRPPYVVYCQGGFHMSQWIHTLDYFLSSHIND